MWGHTVERNVVPHRSTVLHKYRHTTMKLYGGWSMFQEVGVCMGFQRGAGWSEFRALTAWGKKLLSSLAERALMLGKVMLTDPRWRRDLTLRPLRVPKTVLLCLLMLFVRLKILSTYRQFIRNSLQNTSMTAKGFWISETHTNTNSRRRLLRSYKAFAYCWSRTSRPWARLLTLSAQGGVASGVREDGSVVSELG